MNEFPSRDGSGQRREAGPGTRGQAARRGQRTPAEQLRRRAGGRELGGGLGASGGADQAIPARLRNERDRRRGSSRKRIALAVAGAVVGLLVFGAIGAYAWRNAEVGRFESKNASTNAQVTPVLSPARAPGNPFYMVLMGVDMRSNQTIGNSDTLMVAYVDPPRKRLTLLSIPRDTRVDIPGHGVQKINAAALIGGPALTVRTVKQLTGLPISHYLVMNFWGFKDIVNAIGGVYIDVPTKINDIAAANHDRSAALIEPGYQKLDGKHALTFVRARHQFATQDLQRVKDQQAFLKTLAKQTLQLSNLPRAPGIIDAVMRNVTTDLKVGDLLGLEADFKGLDSKSIETATIPGTAQYIGGISYVITDKPALATMVARLEAGQTLVPKRAVATKHAVTVKH